MTLKQFFQKKKAYLEFAICGENSVFNYITKKNIQIQKEIFCLPVLPLQYVNISNLRIIIYIYFWNIIHLKIKTTEIICDKIVKQNPLQ